MNIARANALTAGALEKHFAMHKVAKGHDFWQSGIDCFCFGQHGMPSAIPAMSFIAAMGSASIIAAADGAAIGAVRRLRIARIESRRGSKGQSFTHATSHIVRREQRWPRSLQCQGRWTDCRKQVRENLIELEGCLYVSPHVVPGNVPIT
ncbi:MAG: hypothetical protein J0H54_13155 [Rhizobiales bacterium]|nr:hypothetical protein [Hyphomicrobiales bacterium]